MSTLSRPDGMPVDRDGAEAPREAAGLPLPHGGRPGDALSTFVFEASAGRSNAAGAMADGSSLRVDRPHAEPAPTRSPATDGIEGGPDGQHNQMVLPAIDAWPVVRSANFRQKRRRMKARQQELEKPAESPAAPQSPRDLASVAPLLPPRRLSAWSASVVVHGLLAAALSLVTITQVQPRAMMDLVIAPIAVEELEFSENESAAPDGPGEQLEQTANDVGSEMIDPGEPTLGAEAGAGLVGDLTDDVALVGGGGGGAESGPFGGRGGAGGLFGAGTGGLATFGSGLGGAATAQFFGTRIEGRRIVFVLDNSGSMQAGRLETVIAELKRSVDALAENQEFYIIFYSDAAYPLFYPHGVDHYIRPTDRNKRQLAAWLETVELCLGDAVIDALAAAISIEPDTVFLLSDGRIQGEKKMQFLLGAGGGEFPIHTIGVGLGGATASRRNLQEIAASNRGDFREAAVPAEMLMRSRQRPRPYHNKGPGPIWGRSVKAWSGR
jgi:hypothetical protein